jgi:hypothetical protein
MPANSLTEEQRQTLWEQFVQVYGEEQKAYDSSVRALSAAGVAVTVSLATALRDMPATGTLAVVLFLVSLGINLASYVTSQLDMRARLACLRSGREEGVEGNNWTIATTILNGIAGLAFIAGGVSLAFFVSRST